MQCKKCNSLGSIVLRKKDYYCEQCFIANTNHKFRSSIGKNRVLSSNERVLLGISGGIGSGVLLQLVHDGISLESHKILRITPFCVHIIGFLGNAQNELEIANSVIKQCNNYGFDVYIIHISTYWQEDIIIPEKNCLPEFTGKLPIEYDKMTPTAQHDYIIKTIRNLFIKIADRLQCSYVFTAETTTTLASCLLSNIALGRGPQIQHDVGFSDSRDAIKIIRPMKDISKEELDNYALIKGITVLDQQQRHNDSLQTLIKSFVVDLQENFSATISTVCKTSEKIGSFEHEKPKNTCNICQSDITVKSSKLSALEATMCSKVVCFSHPQQQKIFDIQNANNIIYNNSDSCYACSRYFK